MERYFCHFDCKKVGNFCHLDCKKVGISANVDCKKTQLDRNTICEIEETNLGLLYKCFRERQETEEEEKRRFYGFICEIEETIELNP